MLKNCTQRRDGSQYLRKDDGFIEFVLLRSEAGVSMLCSSDLLQPFLRGHTSLKQQAENKICGLVAERNTSLVSEVIFQNFFWGKVGGKG